MLKQKITVRVNCEDCGTKRKEIANNGEGYWGIIKRLEDEGWLLPEHANTSDPCYCPTCAEVRGKTKE